MPDSTPAELPEEHQDLEHFDEPLFEGSKRRLREHFTNKHGHVDHVRLAKNIVWQDHGFIQAGELSPFIGNIRSYWYARVKPVMARAGLRGEDLTDTYGTLIDQLAELVRDNLLAYRDFGFSDHNASLRLLGRANDHVLIVAEKEGHWPLLDSLHHALSTTVVALGGFPSLLSSEYFVDELHACRLDPGATLHVVFIVDYDPAGWAIADSFLEQLAGRGLENPTIATHLVHPDRMTPEQIRLNRYPLKGRQHNSRNVQWVERGGGLERYGFGKYLGLEADAMPWDQLQQAAFDLVAPHLDVDPARVQRQGATRELVRTLKGLLAERILSAPTPRS